ncbi:hypothetical protein H0H92_011146 [Tricholoma furcatifolium]|nr:hypothetical protein H0H92_011146 [Tricholoma furcatifolium]
MRRALALVSFIALSLAAPSPQDGHVVHERRSVDPVDWEVLGRLEDHRVLPMRFGLSQQNMHRIEDMLMAVSHPDSPTYGKHMTPAEVLETFAPSDDTIATVTNWLAEAGISRDRLRLSISKGWIELNATVAEVESLLKTEYYVYSHAGTGDEQVGCASYSVPAYIQPHIDLIKPTVQLRHYTMENRLAKRGMNLGAPSTNRGPKRSSKKITAEPSLANCDEMITPDCLRALYNFDYTPVSTHENSIGVVEFTPQAFLQEDLNLFFRNYSPSLVGVSPHIVLIDGAVVQTVNQSFDYNGESDLDLEYTMALTNPQTVTLLQTGDLVEGAGFDNWLDAVDKSFCTYEGGDDPTQDGIYPDPLPGGYKGPESCGIIAPPNVVTISYSQDEYTITAASATRQCNEYAKLGLMGTSIFYSSGDFGVAGYDNVCLNSTLQPVANGTVFSPAFPVSCPYVTAVGATQVNPGSTVNDPEGACEQVIYSGGGFSNIFSMPSYQAEVVTSFLTNHPPPYKDGQFNNSGNRKLRDGYVEGARLALCAECLPPTALGIDGEFGLVYGTSASTPVVASMITMVNDARIAAGKGPLGFINPTIYSSSFRAAFNDITSGGNQGCGTPGFTATDGWDPVTGLGTPNFEKLLPLFLSLP